jgi:hypothetical protein
MTIEEKRNIIFDKGIIKNLNEIQIISDDEGYSDELKENEIFFQGYLENGYPFESPYFVYGSEESINAWACSFSNINVVCFNTFTCTKLRDFFYSHSGIINDTLGLFRVNTVYDNNLSCEKVMLQVSEMFLFYHESAHLIQALEPMMLSEKTDETIYNKKFMRHYVCLNIFLRSSRERKDLKEMLRLQITWKI